MGIEGATLCSQKCAILPYFESVFVLSANPLVESSWNVMAHHTYGGGKWRGNWRMEWVASTLHTISEHVVSIITTAHAHTSAASSRLNWRPRRFKWTRPSRRKTKPGYGFSATCKVIIKLSSLLLKRRALLRVLICVSFTFAWRTSCCSLSVWWQGCVLDDQENRGRFPVD